MTVPIRRQKAYKKAHKLANGFEKMLKQYIQLYDIDAEELYLDYQFVTSFDWPFDSPRLTSNIHMKLDVKCSE